MRKKLVSLLILCGILMTMVSCNSNNNSKVNNLTDGVQNSNPQSTDGTGNGGKKNIALVMKTLTNPFFIEMERGARKAENELGINLIVKTGAKETSIDQQIAIVEELINNKVDAIVIAPGSSTELIPILKKAQDAEIKIVNIDNRLDETVSLNAGLKDVPFISVDNEIGAYLSAKVISDDIKSPTNVAILEGIRGADNAEKRKAGALRAFGENKNITIVASETANWNITEAHDIVAKMFAKNNFDAVFCANDMMALGVLQYKTKTNKTNLAIAGFDALTEVKTAIKQGTIKCTIDQQADIQGYTGVKFAYDMLFGKKQPKETLVDVKVITSNNVN